jgi:hypothetical protein
MYACCNSAGCMQSYGNAMRQVAVRLNVALCLLMLSL